jgi:hypothetical protein
MEIESTDRHITKRQQRSASSNAAQAQWYAKLTALFVAGMLLAL